MSSVMSEQSLHRCPPAPDYVPLARSYDDDLAVYGCMRHLISGTSHEEVDMTDLIREAPGLGRGGRMSRQRKVKTVLRLLRGEEPGPGLARTGRHGCYDLPLARRFPGRRRG